jgi:hypothetical protein
VKIHDAVLVESADSADVSLQKTFEVSEMFHPFNKILSSNYEITGSTPIRGDGPRLSKQTGAGVLYNTPYVNDGGDAGTGKNVDKISAKMMVNVGSPSAGGGLLLSSSNPIGR